MINSDQISMSNIAENKDSLFFHIINSINMSIKKGKLESEPLFYFFGLHFDSIFYLKLKNKGKISASEYEKILDQYSNFSTLK
jgi:hypothetical protein